MNAIVEYSPKQLELIRNTVARGTTPDEFNWFMEICKATRLNPLRRQVYCFVFNANNPEKRQMVIVTGIDGYRAIAARSGNYRPGKAFTGYDEAAVDPKTNPLGITHSEVTVYVHSHGDWHEITERAEWSEYAPLIDLWAENEKTGRREKTGKQVLDPKKDAWHRMGRIMLEKCAEARALRRGWPDDLSSVYVDSEVDRSQVLDLTPAEMADSSARETRMAKIGGPALTVDWLDGNELQRVPVGQFGDAAMAFIREQVKAGELSIVWAWKDRNRHTINEYWAHDKDGALMLKQELEKVTQLAAAE